jgi:putative peptidoglycan lipid II flippase
MSLSLNKKEILKKTAQAGSMTLISRILGILREFLLANFFGIGAMSDAFYAALRFPNTLRHIFAEGAMSAAFVPVFVKSLKEGDKKDASGLMTISFLFFESIVLILYIFVLLKTEWAIKIISSGFSQKQLSYAIPFLRILFPFLFLVSASTLFAGALNAVNCFAIPAFGVVIWNIFFIAGALYANYMAASPNYVCAGIILGGFFWLLMNTVIYFKYGFSFGRITPKVVTDFKSVLSKFLPCFFGVGIVEINLFVSGNLSSFLPEGSPTLLYYGSRFMNVPLGVFAVTFSNIMLAHFSRMVLYAPKRLSFYILETTKFVTWAILPVTLFLIFISNHLYTNVMLAKTKDPVLASQGAWILIIYLSGLLFFCLNKSLLTIFYALKDTTSTTIALTCSAFVNLAGDALGIYYFGVYGFAAAASASGIIVTLMCFYFLYKKHRFTFYTGNYLNFLAKYLLQLGAFCFLFLSGYFSILWYVKTSSLYNFFNVGYGYWLIVFSLGSLSMLLMFLTRRLFGIHLHFLDK